MNRIFLVFLCAAVCTWNMQAQTIRSQTVQDGGSGPFKAEVVADKSLPDFTIYRPSDLKKAVADNGKLPIILYANGACANENQQMRYLLNEVVSYGYLAIAIGPYDEADVSENWNNVFNGRGARKKDMPATARKKTSAGQLLEAMDWISGQYADPGSEYYHMVDLEKVVAMGQSCGGAQALAISYDPRIKTTIMMNSGMGDISMGGASRQSLENLHSPIFYIVGGPDDIAYQNARKDYERIKEELAVMINTPDGHHGTYYKEHGGEYSTAVRKWLDWQLKGDEGQAALFLDREYVKLRFPDWSLDYKNEKKQDSD